MKQIKMKTSIISVLCSIMVSGPAQAGQDTIEPEQNMDVASQFRFNFHRQHDRGVYSRLGAGLGYVSASITPPYQGAQVEDEGLRMAYGAHLGGFAVPRLALHLSQWGQIGAQRGGLGLGIGQTFYIKESRNTFISTSLGAVTLYDQAPDVRFAEQWALGGEVEAGLGSWVSSRSSLGASLVAGGHVFDVDQDGISGSSWHVGLRLTWARN